MSNDKRSVRRYVPTTLLAPVLGASLGVDGGPVFQILAVENLGLSAAAIGVAFGFGVVSLPIQLYAARIPIDKARRNLQLFLLLAAVQAWLLAALVGVEATGGVAAIALGITVIAEISVSVLFATAWQPLLADGVDSVGRQRLFSTWAAVARGLLAAALIVFAGLDPVGRSLFLILIGVLAVAAAVGLRSVTPPTRTDIDSEDPATSSKLAPSTRLMLIVFAVVNLAALPLWLVYIDKAFWPEANLGVIAAVQTVASMATLLGWRSTEGDLTDRALFAAVVTLGATVAILFANDPANSLTHAAIVFAATAITAAGTTIVRVAMLEAAHRTITTANTVRAFTLLDVVASTSLQLGLLAAGFLITASTNSDWIADPYLIFVTVAAAATIPAIAAFRGASSARVA